MLFLSSVRVSGGPAEPLPSLGAPAFGIPLCYTWMLATGMLKALALATMEQAPPVVIDCIPLPQEFQKELSQWRKDPSGSKKKPKYSYKTVEELKAKGRVSKKLTAPQKELSQVKVGGSHIGPPDHPLKPLSDE